MRFKCEIEGIDFTIEVEKKEFNSPTRQYILSKQDQRDLVNGEICFYEITITSIKDGEQMIHFSPGHAMTIDEEELLDEVEQVLEEAGLIDKVLEHWELNGKTKPKWGII